MSENDDPYHLRELAARTARGEAMGGEDKIARQHGKGRLTARECIVQWLVNRTRTS